MKKTREVWMAEFVESVRPEFKKIGFPLPTKIRVSCGWPLGRALPDSKGSRSIGQCFSPAWSEGGFHEIFISPVCFKADKVAETLVHELIHAAVGTQCGHKGNFKRAAIEMGLVGPMRSTQAGPALRERLNILCKTLGKYPHRKLDVSKRKKQGTRMIKLQCGSCGYVVRTTQKWVVMGLPVCYCGHEFSIEVSDETSM